MKWNQHSLEVLCNNHLHIEYHQDNQQSITFPPDTLSDGGPILLVKDYENISKLANVENGLRQRGWTQAELDQMLGGNWIRVYRQVWGA